MDAITQRLADKIGDGEIAEMLVIAGVMYPAQIRQMSNSELKAVLGSDSLVSKVRGKIKVKAKK